MTPLFDIDLEQCSTFFLNLPWVAWKKTSAGEKEESKYQTLWLSMGLSILGGQWKWWSLQIPWAYGSIFDWVGFWSQIRIWETWLQNNWLREVFLFSCGKKHMVLWRNLNALREAIFFCQFWFWRVEPLQSFDCIKGMVFAQNSVPCLPMGSDDKLRSIPTPCMEGPSVEAWCGLFGYLEWKGLRQ